MHLLAKLIAYSVKEFRVVARAHVLARSQRTLLHDDDQRLILAEPEHILHARPALAVLALDRANVRDLTSTGRVERGLR